MIAIISVSKQGNALASLLSEKINEEAICYTLAKYDLEGFQPIKGRIRHFCKFLFQEYEALIFIMATGIVVRSIAPWIKDKTSDPAVVVIDDKGQHVISLLSGHIGGANNLTEEVAMLINAQPVITTSSDVNNLPAVDTLAQEKDLIIDSMNDAKIITSMIINNQKVELVDEHGVFEKDILPDTDGEICGRLIVSNKFGFDEPVPFVRLIPENIVLGVGCKKNTGSHQLWEFIKENLYALNLDLRSVKTIASIDIKAEEKAIIDAAEYLQCTNCFYNQKQLQEVDHLFEGSDFVKSTVGVASVSTTSAYLAGNEKGKFLIRKAKKDGMTLSIFETTIN
ncbi:cobalt-precorrin 5A hydrolase [Plebeiibacterium marinum]|uniref:Cobalt-precorrin 5A hydrolase n=1 Tax=Plebeiibacterium marinum TaxID=2992111 RepID=A0AAE3MGQ3_9BACT|nr:cobalt-precorrin 5A hydrolase [Plebeiobacterium marinum]MCW3807181.1 cobalt-precorrin 5A hydrolase [Plebeiobacterium marinum]